MPERNEELFFAVADQIEREPRTYSQRSYYNGCGTTACIAGWAVAIAKHNGDLSEARQIGDWAGNCAKELLGLTQDESLELFFSFWRPHDGLSVPDALRKIGEGAKIEDVSA